MAPGIDFLFPRRIARVSYVLRTLGVVLSGRFLANHLNNLEANTRGDFTAYEIGAGLLLFVYWCAWVARPRFVDLSMSAWCTLLILVPELNLFLAGYLTWGRTKVRADWPPSALPAADGTPVSPALSTPPSSPADTLRRLQALRADGTLSEEQFQRMKDRHRL